MEKQEQSNLSKYCIYVLENKVNGMKYIGQTKNLSRRKSSHIGKLNKDNHPNAKLQKDWIKYGKKSFAFNVIEYCDKSSADEKEMYYISFFDTVNNGYNISKGGTNGNNFPRKRIKQYDLNGNFIRIWESAAEVSRYYGINRATISRAVKYHRKALNYQWCYENEEVNGFYARKNQYPIAQYDRNNNMIKVYKNLDDIIKQNEGFLKNNIFHSMTHKWGKTAYGYIWKKITKEDYYEFSRQGY